MRSCIALRYLAKGTRAALSAVMFPGWTAGVSFSTAVLQRSNRIGWDGGRDGAEAAPVGSAVATVT